jgi:hypothetical protein
MPVAEFAKKLMNGITQAKKSDEKSCRSLHFKGFLNIFI